MLTRDQRKGVGGQLSSTIFWQSIDGGQTEVIVGPREGELWLEDWSRDSVLVFDAFDPETGENADVWFITPESSEPKVFLANPWDEWGGRLSPDGGWIAYSSDESGESKIYVADFPAHTARLQISTNPGLGKEPAWSASGDEVYFSGGGRFFSVRVRTEGGLSADPPQFLFEGSYATVGGYDFDVAPDGRFFLLKEPEQTPATEIRLVTNWFDELNERARAN